MMKFTRIDRKEARCDAHVLDTACADSAWGHDTG